MKKLPAGIALTILFILAPARAGADIIQSGFNDAAGTNSDGIVNNSPFNINNPLGGQGAGEPGWAGPWQMTTGSAFVVGQRSRATAPRSSEHWRRAAF